MSGPGVGAMPGIGPSRANHSSSVMSTRTGAHWWAEKPWPLTGERGVGNNADGSAGDSGSDDDDGDIEVRIRRS